MTWYKDQGGETTVIETLDDIPDGVTWKKSANDFSDTDKAKLDALSLTGLTADETITFLNTAATSISLDRIDDSSSTKKLVTAGELIGAQRASAILTADGVNENALVGGKSLAVIKAQTDTAFLKDSDTLDNIADGTSKKSVSGDYVDESGRLTAMYDAAQGLKRGLGTGANSIPVLDDESRLAGSLMPKKALMQNVAGKIETSEAIPVKIDDLAMDGNFKAVSVESGSEDLQTRIFWSHGQIDLNGGLSLSPFSTQSTSGNYDTWVAVPVVFDNLDKNMKIKALARLVGISFEPTGNIRFAITPDAGGSPDLNPANFKGYEKIDVTEAGYEQSIITKTDFFTSWSLVEGTLYWLVIQARVGDAQDTIEMSAPIVYLESKILA